MVWSTNMGDRYQFPLRLAKSRWLVMVAAILIQSSAGATYSFAIYSQAIKDALGYDQKHLDTLATWKDLGANMGIVSGLVFEAFPPQGVLAIGIVQNFLAYLAVWLSVTGRVGVPAFWQMCLYMFFAANAQTFMTTASVVTCVQNFPQNRGVVIGLIKGVIGLSGAILTEFYHGVYGDEPTSYILMAAWLPSVTVLLVMVTIRSVPAREERHENKNLFRLSLIVFWLAMFIMGVILLEAMTDIHHSGHVAALVIIYGILLLSMWVAVKAELEEATTTSSPSLHQPLMINNSSSVSGPLAVDTAGEVEGTEQISKSRRTRSLGDTRAVVTVPEKDHLPDLQQARRVPSRGEDHTILEALGKSDFWLLVLAMACSLGGGLTAIDNTGQIGASLGYSPEAVATFISLFSIWNCLGRLGFGALSEWCLHKYKVGRPVLLASSQACMSLGYVLISSALPASLYPALVVIGLGYGAQWSLMPAITSELFGLSRFATLFNAISIASPIAAYFLSVQVAGRLYDMEAEKDNHDIDPEDFECYGAHCFRLALIILSAVSVLGCALCALLAHRTKAFYAQLLHNSRGRKEHFQEAF